MFRKTPKQNNQSGFTLVEVIASMAAFVVVFSIASTLFTSSVDLQRQGTSFRVVQQNAGFFMEFLGREIRNGAIDFATYEGQSIDLNIMPVENLKLLYRGSQDQREEVYLQDGKIYVKRERTAQPGVYDTSELTDDSVVVDKLDFYISPAEACTLSSTECSQPRVTVALELHYDILEVRGVNGLTANFQNTFSTRLYDF